MTRNEKLRLIEDQLLDRILEVTLEKKPSYSVDGQSISWESYLATLNSELANVQVLLSQGEPFEHESTGDVNSW